MPDSGPLYTAYYCEENVWHLAVDPRVGPGERVVAVIANETKGVACYGQRAAAVLGEPVFWDYHVVLLRRPGGGAWEVWDLDTVHGMPLPALAWIRATFGPAGSLPRAFAPVFRLMRADTYRRALVTDRSHMRGPDGAWLQPPPPWPPPGAGAPTLGRLCDVTDPFVGELVDRDTLEARIRDGALCVDEAGTEGGAAR